MDSPHHCLESWRQVPRSANVDCIVVLVNFVHLYGHSLGTKHSVSLGELIDLSLQIVNTCIRSVDKSIFQSLRLLDCDGADQSRANSRVKLGCAYFHVRVGECQSKFELGQADGSRAFVHYAVVVAQAEDVPASDSCAVEDAHSGHRKLDKARHDLLEAPDGRLHVLEVSHPVWQVESGRKVLLARADTDHDSRSASRLDFVQDGQVRIYPVQVPRVVLSREDDVVEGRIEDVSYLLLAHLIYDFVYGQRHLLKLFKFFIINQVWANKKNI